MLVLDNAVAMARFGPEPMPGLSEIDAFKAPAGAAHDRPRARALLEQSRAHFAGLALRFPKPQFQKRVAHLDELLAR